MRNSRKYFKRSLSKRNSKKNNRRFPKKNTNKNFKKNNKVNSRKNNRRLLKRNTNKKLKIKNKTKKNKFTMVGGSSNLYTRIKEEIEKNIISGNSKIPMFLGNISLKGITSIGLPNKYASQILTGFHFDITELFKTAGRSNDRARDIHSLLNTYSLEMCNKDTNINYNFEGNNMIDDYNDEPFYVNFINDLDKNFSKKYGMFATSNSRSDSDRKQNMGNCILKLIQDYNKIYNLNRDALKDNIFSGFNNSTLNSIKEEMEKNGIITADSKSINIFLLTNSYTKCMCPLELIFIKVVNNTITISGKYELREVMENMISDEICYYECDYFDKGIKFTISDLKIELSLKGKPGEKQFFLTHSLPQNSSKIMITDSKLEDFLSNTDNFDGFERGNPITIEGEIENKLHKKISHSPTNIKTIDGKRVLVPNNCLKINIDNINCEPIIQEALPENVNFAGPSAFIDKGGFPPIIDDAGFPVNVAETSNTTGPAFIDSDGSYAEGTVTVTDTPLNQPEIQSANHSYHLASASGPEQKQEYKPRQLIGILGTTASPNNPGLVYKSHTQAPTTIPADLKKKKKKKPPLVQQQAIKVNDSCVYSYNITHEEAVRRLENQEGKSLIRHSTRKKSDIIYKNQNGNIESNDIYISTVNGLALLNVKINNVNYQSRSLEGLIRKLIRGNYLKNENCISFKL